MYLEKTISTRLGVGHYMYIVRISYLINIHFIHLFYERPYLIRISYLRNIHFINFNLLKTIYPSPNRIHP